jgi:hypothetical protein
VEIGGLMAKAGPGKSAKLFEKQINVKKARAWLG